MKTAYKNTHDPEPVENTLITQVRDDGWTYIKTIVDVAHEPIVILDHTLKVLAANGAFYRTFQVEPKDTERKVIYELGNGQWDIPSLRKLLEDILPHNTFFNGFEVTHTFPSIGHKSMILNAREIHTTYNHRASINKLAFPSIIMLAIEDVTDMMIVADTLTTHTGQVESRFLERTRLIDLHIDRLEKEINALKLNNTRL